MLWLSSSVAWAQDSKIPPPPVTKNPVSGTSNLATHSGGLVEFFSARTPYEFWLAVLAAVTGLFVISLIAWTVTRMEHVRPEDITRPAIVITIIIGALILIIAGYSNEQIAAAFGLFGTIVGYMLGRMNSQPTGRPHPTEPPDGEGHSAPASASARTA
jgi:hypothetical protein